MSVATTTNRISYTGDGVTTAFSYPYKFLQDADLVVKKRLISTGVETLMVLTTDYTLTGSGEDAGGTVTMIVSPSALYELVIYGDPELTQEVNLEENDSSPAEVQEGALDKLTLAAQRLSDRVDRAVRLSDGFAPDFDTTLPADLDDSADKVPIVNSTGDGWADAADWPDSGDLADAAANATAAAASAAAALASQAAAAASAAAVQTVTVQTLTISDFPFTIPANRSGYRYNVDLAGATALVTMQLPTPVLNLFIGIKDVKGMFDLYGGLKFLRHGSEKIEFVAADFTVEDAYGYWELYSDATDWFLRKGS